MQILKKSRDFEIRTLGTLQHKAWIALIDNGNYYSLILLVRWKKAGFFSNEELRYIIIKEFVSSIKEGNDALGILVEEYTDKNFDYSIFKKLN